MILDAGSQLVLGIAFAVCFMTVLWVVPLRTLDAGIVDVGWATSLAILAISYVATLPAISLRSFIVAAMASVWSLRLAIYLFRDRVLGKPEDGRYQKLRTGYGSWSQLFFLIFFQAQAALAWIFALPFWFAMRRQGGLDLWDVLAMALWIVCLTGESLADAQLSRFRADPGHRGKTCRDGLWRYSRHPNYFFEWLYWWVFVLMSWTVPYGWVTLLAPALMLFFLFKVTGIPATEAQAVRSRGDDYRDYQRTTSVFVPWFPKKSSH